MHESISCATCKLNRTLTHISTISAILTHFLSSDNPFGPTLVHKTLVSSLFDLIHSTSPVVCAIDFHKMFAMWNLLERISALHSPRRNASVAEIHVILRELHGFGRIGVVLVLVYKMQDG